MPWLLYRIRDRDVLAIANMAHQIIKKEVQWHVDSEQGDMTRPL